jgi:hypothetical protein
MRAIAIILFVLVTACSTSKQSDNYKILFGKRCTPDSTKFSYIWFHTTEGQDQVRKEWCK